VSAIAQKAGVQRHTYYAHFPELKDLYRACTAHHLERNPLPDPSRWAEISGPEERLRRALSEVYAWYAGNEEIMTNVLRDTPLDPVLQENNALLFRHWEAMRDTVADAFGASGEQREALLAAVALALDLQTWRTLVRRQGLGGDRAIGLMVGTVRCLMRS
jgi:AcrR family transcriptional regulator